MNQKEIILEQLKSMGFEPINMPEVGYVFKYEEMNYLYMPEEDDEQFLRIVIPHLFEVTEENRVAVLDAMHETGLLLKYAKVCIMYGDTVWAIYEHRLCAADNLSDLLEHIIRVLALAVYVFNKKINGEDIGRTFDESEEMTDDELEAEMLKMLEGFGNEEEEI